MSNATQILLSLAPNSNGKFVSQTVTYSSGSAMPFPNLMIERIFQDETSELIILPALNMRSQILGSLTNNQLSYLTNERMLYRL